MAEVGEYALGFNPDNLMENSHIGSGSYGRVCKYNLGALTCAAKILHPILVDPNNPRNQEKFEQECRLLKGIRHPNIVQCLGVHRYEESGVPRTVLLMELMDESLTKFLERFTEKRLLYHVQVNISHNVALALAFLHSNNIIHRDLSSNNVLLIGPGNRAKVTDFGMSKLNLRTSNLTQCPGTMQYMPPEAFGDPPRYTVKLDCFQVGVLMVQVMTKEFPAPTGRFREEENRKSEVGWINIPISEVSRRENHLSLVSVIIQC